MELNELAQLQGASISYPVEVGAQQDRKVSNLQTLSAAEEAHHAQSGKVSGFRSPLMAMCDVHFKGMVGLAVGRSGGGYCLMSGN